ncbi:MAG: hypothetical protein V4506_05730 [Bacteroidota bacterium]
MKKTIFMACLSIAVSGQMKSQIFINTTGTTNNTDPTYHNGSVSIGKTTAAVEKLDVEGNIGIPFGSYIGVNTSSITNRKFLQTGWDATNGDYLSFFTAGNVLEDQYEKFRVVSSGNFGIGITTPKARLHVYEGAILGTTVGNFQIITSKGGRPDNTASGYNNMFNNVWLVRSEAGNDWWKAKFHDGISLETANITPGTDTKTWWERHPYLDQQRWGNDANIYMQLDKGRLGINRTTPSARLDIAETDNSYITFLARDEHTVDNKYCMMASVTRDLTKAFTVANNLGTYKEPFVVYGNGQTQIGIKKSTAHANAMLMVDGKIVCKDLYVTATSDWPDFVFDANYKLTNLYDVRDYYEKNKHLPNVPTACEIEEKGINISEISNIQMQKIEELTLYIVQLKMELDALKKEVTNKK